MNRVPSSAVEKVKKRLEKECPSTPQNAKSLSQICIDVAKEEGCNAKSLRRKVYRSQKDKKRAHGNMLLKDEEELKIVGYAIASSLHHHPLTGQEIKAMAKALFPHLCRNSLESWFCGFQKRHEEYLRPSVAKAIPLACVTTHTFDQTKTFCDAYETLLEKYKPKPENIDNCDETILVFKFDHFNCRVFESSFKQASSTASKQGGKPIVLIPFVSASGKVAYSVYILPESNKADEKQTVTLSFCTSARVTWSNWEHGLVVKGKGYMTKELWPRIIKKFVDVIKTHDPQNWKFLIMDWLSSHMDIETMKICLENKILMVYIPPHTSHFLQPLDQMAFGLFKSQLNRLVGNYLRKEKKNLPSMVELVQSLARIAEKRSLTPNVIQRSWHDSGLYLFDKFKIVDAAKKNVGRN